MRENKSYRFANLLSFIDLLFNLMLGSLAMFLLSLQMMAPIVKKINEDVPRSADVVVRMEWQGSSDHDIDLWVKGPTGEVSGFQSKESPTMHLERDNLGTDTNLTQPGHINEEMVSIRQVSAGWYVVNVHYYTDRTDSRKPEVKWSVTQMKPVMTTIATGTLTLNHKGEEKTAIRFLVNDKGQVIDSETTIQTPFIMKGVVAPRRGQ